MSNWAVYIANNKPVNLLDTHSKGVDAFKQAYRFIQKVPMEKGRGLSCYKIYRNDELFWAEEGA